MTENNVKYHNSLIKFVLNPPTSKAKERTRKKNMEMKEKSVNCKWILKKDLIEKSSGDSRLS